ncbi:MAG: glutamate--tRNA ligase [Chloroflexi bacterium]|nr:glutamate--tRNA ligase [Chloroflexota bacterium]
MMTVRTRFAPSPTGYMHIGNLRTALFAYLAARRYGGKFILRIEDTDQERNVPESLAAIYSGLALAGLEYDEGPDKDGGYGPYTQSKRLSIYQAHAEQLLVTGAAFRCFCKKEATNLEDSEPGEPADADGAAEPSRRDPCRLLTNGEIETKINAGEPFVIRQRIPDSGSTTFEDRVYGTITIDNVQLDDQVLLKSDGFPTYNFANVVDDHLMGITHVMRGQEYLSSTPKYNLLYEAFGWPIPIYVHLPLIVKLDGSKLSKRLGDPSFEDLVMMGYLPEAIVNYIALLGWSPGDDQELFSLAELTQVFSIDRINKASAIFSLEKLTWINGEHIRALSIDEFHTLAEKYYPDELVKYNTFKISELMQVRTEKLTDIPQMVDFFTAVPEYDVDMYQHDKSKCTPEISLEVLKAVTPILNELSDWDNDSLYGALQLFAKAHGYKIGTVMWPIRTALSGVPATPGGATALAEILGKAETLARIDAGIKKLEHVLN